MPRFVITHPANDSGPVEGHYLADASYEPYDELLDSIAEQDRRDRLDAAYQRDSRKVISRWPDKDTASRAFRMMEGPKPKPAEQEDLPF